MCGLVNVLIDEVGDVVGVALEVTRDVGELEARLGANRE